MPPRTRVFYSTLGLVFFFLAAAPLYRELSQRSDIWWTPRPMMVPLAETKDRVEIYVRGKPLAALIQEGGLQISENGASSALAASDVGIRFNNWDRVRAQRLPLLLTYAAACGIAAFLVLLVLSGRLAYREERGRGACSF
jgi:hypothetical protein